MPDDDILKPQDNELERGAREIGTKPRPPNSDEDIWDKAFSPSVLKIPDKAER